MKYQFEESMKEVLRTKKGTSDALNRKIFKDASATEKSQPKTYFYPGRSAACAAIVIVAVLLTGGIGISYAAGVKPVQTILDRFTKLDKDVMQKEELSSTAQHNTNHKLTLDEHYLDALGNGYMAFSLTKQDGTKEKDLAYGNKIKAFYTDTEKKTTTEFACYDIEPVYSKQMKSIDGIKLSFYGTQFPADGGEILIKMGQTGKETFTFSDIKVTQPHYYEWKSPEGSVFLSSVGMIAEGNTKVCNAISDTIGTEDTEAIATLVYQNGHQDSLQLSMYCGDGDDSTNNAVIQFSPWTELQKHLEEYQKAGKSVLELMDEWDYNFSIYTFELDKIWRLQIGDTVLDVKEASYH